MQAEQERHRGRRGGQRGRGSVGSMFRPGGGSIVSSGGRGQRAGREAPNLCASWFAVTTTGYPRRGWQQGLPAWMWTCCTASVQHMPPLWPIHTTPAHAQVLGPDGPIFVMGGPPPGGMGGAFVGGGFVGGGMGGFGSFMR